MVGGFHIAALVRYGWHSEARHLLSLLAEVNYKGLSGNWDFNEWIHGESGHPMGYSKQAWSASMFLYAYHAVHSGQLPLFDKLLKVKPSTAQGREIDKVYKQAGGGPV
jgi:glycogen debranching enzyme